MRILRFHLLWRLWFFFYYYFSYLVSVHVKRKEKNLKIAMEKESVCGEFCINGFSVLLMNWFNTLLCSAWYFDICNWKCNNARKEMKITVITSLINRKLFFLAEEFLSSFGSSSSSSSQFLDHLCLTNKVRWESTNAQHKSAREKIK